MPSSSKKRKTSKEDSSSNEEAAMSPRDLISQSRKRACSSLKNSLAHDIDGTVDLDHLIRTTWAIYTTNREIWERCEGKKSEPPCSDDSSSQGLRFKRISFPEVRVSTTARNPRSSNHYSPERETLPRAGEFLKFETRPVLMVKDFGSPPALPRELLNIIAPITSSAEDDATFPDYEAFLDTSLLLNEDVLIPFLTKLKEHLELVQVFLGEIDAWLMETSSCIELFQTSFGSGTTRSAIVMPKHEDFKPVSTTSPHFLPTQTSCLRCHKPYCTHRIFRFGKNQCCPVSSGYDEGEFFAAAPQTLARCKISGTHHHTFDIDTDAGRILMKKFLEFVIVAQRP
jgi:hypothetical protein